jgi:hypothetical protein
VKKETLVEFYNEHQENAAAGIRGVWTFIMPGVGFIVVYMLENIMTLGWFSTPLALGIGGLLYAIKKKAFPDTIL